MGVHLLRVHWEYVIGGDWGIVGVQLEFVGSSFLVYLKFVGGSLEVIRESLHSRYHSRFFDCLAHPNLSATLATDQK